MIKGGHSAFSTGPSCNTTPQDQSSFHVPMTDSPFNMTNYGPPYAIPPQSDQAPKEGSCQYCGGAHEGSCK